MPPSETKRYGGLAGDWESGQDMATVFLAFRYVSRTIGVLEGSDKLARDAFVHSESFTSLVLFYAFIINYNMEVATM